MRRMAYTFFVMTLISIAVLINNSTGTGMDGYKNASNLSKLSIAN